MNYEKLQEMDEQEYADYIEEKIDEALQVCGEDPWRTARLLDAGNGHGSIHAGMSSDELFRQILEGGKIAAGSFENETSARQFVLSTMVFLSYDIAQWFRTGDPGKHGGDPDRLIIDIDVGEKTGRTISRTYREYVSTGVKIILDRNPSGEAPLGFSLKTAYPSPTRITPTGRKVDPQTVALANLGYKDPIERIYAYAHAQKNVRAFVTPGRKEVKVTTYIDETHRVDMHFEDNGTSRAYMLELPNPRRLLSDAELSSYPETAGVFWKIRDLAERVIAREAERRNMQERTPVLQDARA